LISADSTETDFKTYFSEMPWLAVPFGNSHPFVTKIQHQAKFIPRLIMVSKGGNVITADGVEKVLEYLKNETSGSKQKQENL
jgi:nucleoredoxin